MLSGEALTELENASKSGAGKNSWRAVVIVRNVL